MDFFIELVFEIVLEGLGALASELVPKSVGTRTAKVLRRVFTVITFLVFIALIAGIIMMLSGKFFTAGIIIAAMAVVYIAILVTVKLLHNRW